MDFGLLPSGFVPMRQSDVLDELNAALRQSFGANLNLGPASVLGQVSGILSERIALAWEALEAVYISQFPSGAEGVSVDNILALNGLVRLSAAPTRTNRVTTVQTNGIPLYGLVLYGVPGTLVPKGSVVQTASDPATVFSLDDDVSIGQPANSIQSLVLSNAPTMGTYSLIVTAPSGQGVTVGPIRYDALVRNSFIRFASTPTSGTYRLAIGSRLTAAIAYNATAAQVQAAIQLDPANAGITVSSTSDGFLISWPSGIAPPLSTRIVRVTYSPAPSTGSYSLSLNGAATSSLPYGADRFAVRDALRAIPGYSGIDVLGTIVDGFSIVWNCCAPATVTVTANSTGATIAATDTYGLNSAATVVNSLQAQLNAAIDPADGSVPFSDLGVAGSGNTRTVTFGANSPLDGQPASGSKPQPRIQLASNSLQASGQLTNINIVYNQAGARAQGVGSATCQVNGPNFVAAHQLKVIGSPVSGWDSVDNPLDCITGSNVESGKDALARLDRSRSTQANGSMQAILNEVSLLDQVQAVVGFQNRTDAANQLVEFVSTPSGGTFALALGEETTATLNYDATTEQVRAALAALSGLSVVRVTGTPLKGYDVNFNGARGGQAQPMLRAVNNTTGVDINTAWGQPPKSFQVLVEGGSPADIGAAIFRSSPAGISSYGAPVARTTATIAAGSASIDVASNLGIVVGQAVSGPGIPSGVTVVSIANTTLTLSAPSIGTFSQARVIFYNSIVIRDAYLSPNIISFSRPEHVLIYVSIQLITDTYNTPGNSSSGPSVSASFSVDSIDGIQSNVVSIINSVPIGGLIVAQGSNGLIGAFNAVPGIIGYNLTLGTSPSPSQSQNIRLQPGQSPLAEKFNVTVSFT